MRESQRRGAAALLLLLYLPSCTYWRPVTTPLAELTSSSKPPQLVRVTTYAGERLEVEEPRVHADTLIGGSRPDTGWVFLAVADISKVELKKRQPARTALYVVLAVGLVYLIAELCENPDNCSTDDEEE